ncbi:MAG TPA: tetratricopeptide repeat protein [Lacipirellulaceae bacterium]|nr:tetratricopeptide repeat protein [Lacipirellulaceae bacterium]
MSKRAKTADFVRPPKGGVVVRASSERYGRPPAWAVVLLLGFLIAAVYGPALNVPFVFDDRATILANDSILSMWPLVGSVKPGPLNPPAEMPISGRPLVNLSFAINYYFGKFNPAGYHAVNIAIHFLASLLVWATMRRTLQLPYFGGHYEQTGGWLALIVALLWALHPLQTEAVIYVTQRTELAMACCYLATLYCSVRYLEVGGGTNSGVWLCLALLACLAGMASKEVMVSAPLMVLLFDRTFVSGTLANAVRRSWRLHASLFATWILLFALNWSLPHSDATGFSQGISGPTWWLTQSKIFFLYLKLAIWPWPLLFHYAMPYFTTLGEAWMYVVPLLLIGFATLWLLWKNWPLGFLGTWYFALLAPTFVIPIVTEMAAERRMYLPLLVPVIIVVLAAYQVAEAIVRRRSVVTAGWDYRRPLAGVGVLAVILAIAFCLVSSLRLGAYGSELNLWAEVLTAQPDNAMAHHAIGYYYEHAGDDESAMKEYLEATRLNPDAAQVHYMLALLLQKHGRHDEAVTHFAEAVRVLPKSAAMRNDLGVAQYLANRNEDAIATFHTVLAVDPNYWTAERNLAAAYWKLGKKPEAFEAYQAAVRINPKAVEVYIDLSKAYEANGEPEKSVAVLKQGLEVARSIGDNENAGRISQRLGRLAGKK